MERRDFIKKGCIACFALTSVGALLSSCQTLPIIKSSVGNKLIKVPSNNFAAGKMIIVRAKELENDILLIKLSDSEYKAVLMVCTHQEMPLVATNTGLVCNSHGSRFDLNGKVLAGPAISNLKVYNTEVEGDQVVVHLS